MDIYNRVSEIYDQIEARREYLERRHMQPEAMTQDITHTTHDGHPGFQI